ncbi:nitrogen fixation protein NifZ [Varunaivibrio sulfuroxidans]|uniref:Nitrogen fixation protein NifZ n=1 Tax=Varunaivibrio sulfuroxidans TaxID=1773489 RepID=A0A4R3J779_9PROT|nr:nitrogen fixation protein NifZ [Varunaivibrio sulfuroxidans]TCS61769.1 nitrogen fixation protein NifZ [Varunaivibrio sulfuroxidans]WES32047.1 nitrogen fixation protein NifZ [Varunaivibrio sulfuroxidans]
MKPQFDYGDGVRVMRTVRNDGTFPGEKTGARLVSRGSVGFVQNVGTFLQDQIIYAVHFLDEDKLVGCREEELQRADAPWVPRRFEFRDKVTAKVAFSVGGTIVVEAGREGEIVKTLNDDPSRGAVVYHVRFPGRTLVVAEEQLSPCPAAQATGARSGGAREQ